MLHTTSEMGSKGGEDSQWGWWGWQVVKAGWGWWLYVVQLQRERVGEALNQLYVRCMRMSMRGHHMILTVLSRSQLWSIFKLPDKYKQYVPIVSFFCFFFVAYPIYCLMGPHHMYCLWWSIIACRCLNNKSQITCICKMVISNASVPQNHRWILTYHLRQFPENVALLLPMGSRSVQVFYNLCWKKIKRVFQCPESEGSRLRDSKW